MRYLGVVTLLFAAACVPERYQRSSHPGADDAGADGEADIVVEADASPDGADDGGAEDADAAGQEDGGGGDGTGGDAPDGGGSDGSDGATCMSGAVQFDGVDDFLTVSRQVQDDFTIEGWIKTAVPSLTGARFFHGSGLFYADVMGMANDFAVAVLNNRLVFAVGDTTLVQSSSEVTTGKWIHVAMFRVRATGTIGLVINGVQDAIMASAMTASLTAPVSITFGGNTVDRRFFNGVVDDVRIWSVARTPAEIQANMNRTLAGTEAGLVGYWRFDEPSGTTFADSTPSHNDAVGSGSAIPARVISDAPICH